MAPLRSSGNSSNGSSPFPSNPAYFCDSPSPFPSNPSYFDDGPSPFPSNPAYFDDGPSPFPSNPAYHCESPSNFAYHFDSPSPFTPNRQNNSFGSPETFSLAHNFDSVSEYSRNSISPWDNNPFRDSSSVSVPPMQGVRGLLEDEVADVDDPGWMKLKEALEGKSEEYRNKYVKKMWGVEEPISVNKNLSFHSIRHRIRGVRKRKSSPKLWSAVKRGATLSQFYEDKIKESAGDMQEAKDSEHVRFLKWVQKFVQYHGFPLYPILVFLDLQRAAEFFQLDVPRIFVDHTDVQEFISTNGFLLERTFSEFRRHVKDIESSFREVCGGLENALNEAKKIETYSKDNTLNENVPKDVYLTEEQEMEAMAVNISVASMASFYS